MALAEPDDFVVAGPMTKKSRRVKAAKKFIISDENSGKNKSYEADPS